MGSQIKCWLPKIYPVNVGKKSKNCRPNRIVFYIRSSIIQKCCNEHVFPFSLPLRQPRPPNCRRLFLHFFFFRIIYLKTRPLAAVSGVDLHWHAAAARPYTPGCPAPHSEYPDSLSNSTSPDAAENSNPVTQCLYNKWNPVSSDTKTLSALSNVCPTNAYFPTSDGSSLSTTACNGLIYFLW